MLVITRRIGETILAFPPDRAPIEIVVNRISGNRVTLGVKADATTRLVRGELEPHADEPQGGEEAQQ